MKSRPLAVDLFAGAGGLSLGLSWSGFEVIAAVEFDAWAAHTYAANHGPTKLINRDITRLSNAALSEFSNGKDIRLLAGGPPCQGFSISGPANKDPKDPRNSLFMEMVRAAAILKPEVILLENVPGLLKRQNEAGAAVIDVIQKELDQIGYRSEFILLNAADFGVPQYRERLFIVGRKGRILMTGPQKTILCSYGLRNEKRAEPATHARSV